MYGRTIQSRWSVASTQLWSLVLSRCKRKVAFFSDLTLEVWAFSSLSTMTYSKTQCISLYPLRVAPWTFFNGRFTCQHSTDCCFDWLIVVTPYLLTGNGAIQEPVTFSLALTRWYPMNLHQRNVPLWAFMRSVYCKLCNIPVFPQSFPMHWSWCSVLYTVPCRNPPICMDQLIDTLLILWCDSCV